MAVSKSSIFFNKNGFSTKKKTPGRRRFQAGRCTPGFRREIHNRFEGDNFNSILRSIIIMRLLRCEALLRLH